MDIDCPTRFEDWIREGPLRCERGRDPPGGGSRTTRSDEADRRVAPTPRTVITAGEARQRVEARPHPGRARARISKLNSLLTAIDELSIVGCAAQAGRLSASLSHNRGQFAVTQGPALAAIQGLLPDPHGRALLQRGRVQAETRNGVTYTLRFGEVVYGRGRDHRRQRVERRPGSGPGGTLPVHHHHLRPAPRPRAKRPENLAFQSKAEGEWSGEDRRTSASSTPTRRAEGSRCGRTASEELTPFCRLYYVIPPAPSTRCTWHARPAQEEGVLGAAGAVVVLCRLALAGGVDGRRHPGSDIVDSAHAGGVMDKAELAAQPAILRPPRSVSRVLCDLPRPGTRSGSVPWRNVSAPRLLACGLRVEVTRSLTRARASAHARGSWTATGPRTAPDRTPGHVPTAVEPRLDGRRLVATAPLDMKGGSPCWSARSSSWRAGEKPPDDMLVVRADEEADVRSPEGR